MGHRVRSCGTTASALSRARGPAGGEPGKTLLVVARLLTELQEAWECGACILFIGQKSSIAKQTNQTKNKKKTPRCGREDDEKRRFCRTLCFNYK